MEADRSAGVSVKSKAGTEASLGTHGASAGSEERKTRPGQEDSRGSGKEDPRLAVFPSFRAFEDFYFRDAMGKPRVTKRGNVASDRDVRLALDHALTLTLPLVKQKLLNTKAKRNAFAAHVTVRCSWLRAVPHSRLIRLALCVCVHVCVCVCVGGGGHCLIRFRPRYNLIFAVLYLGPTLWGSCERCVAGK